MCCSHGNTQESETKIIPDNLKVKRALTCKVKFDQNSVQSQPEPGLT